MAVGPVEPVDDDGDTLPFQLFSPGFPPVPPIPSPRCGLRGRPPKASDGLKVSLRLSGRIAGADPAVPVLSTTGLNSRRLAPRMWVNRT